MLVTDTSSNLWDILAPIQSGPLFSWGHSWRPTLGTGICLQWDSCLLGNWPYPKMCISVSCGPTVQCNPTCMWKDSERGQQNTRVVTWGTLWAIRSGWGQELQYSGSPAIGLNSLWAARLPSQWHKQSCVPRLEPRDGQGVFVDLEPGELLWDDKDCLWLLMGQVWGPGQGMAAAKMQKITETRTYWGKI